MKAVFSEYPRLTLQLAGLYFLEQICYFYAHTVRIDIYAWKGYPSIDVAHFPYNLITYGGMIILGAWLADQMGNKKNALLLGVALLLFGQVTFLTTNLYLNSFGFALVNLGNALFLVTAILHNAILYPRADDYKDNSFMLFIVASSLAWIVSSFLSGLVFQYGHGFNIDQVIINEVFLFLVSSIVFISVLLAILRTKEIGLSLPQSIRQSNNNSSLIKKVQKHGF